MAMAHPREAGGYIGESDPIMALTLATWNINSVRLRKDLMRRLVEATRPDIVCLQEIKCEAAQFPADFMRELGFAHMAVHGQRGYHGVATLSRLPIESLEGGDHNGSGDSRHVAVRISGPKRNSIEIHNFYVPSGGDIPDPDENVKFRQKLDYLAGMTRWCEGLGRRKASRMVLVGDLNIAPLEHDVWSHKQLLDVVSHTPVEVEHLARLQASLAWHDVMRAFVPPSEKLYTWWSYRAQDWKVSDRGRRLDHIWVTPDLAASPEHMHVLRDARDWPQPSDHVPVICRIALD